MTTHDSYANRYSKSREKKLHSLSPHPTNNFQQPSQASCEPLQKNSLGKVVSKLTDRIDGVQIKITSLTNIVKLLQKYTQTKDQQYQKQKQNHEFKVYGNAPILQSNELQTKIKQIEMLSQRMKSEITAVESLRVGISRENSQKYLVTSPPEVHTPIGGADIFLEVQAMIGDLQENLREEMNKKIDICMSCLKKAIENSNLHAASTSREYASPKTINSMNTIMLQEEFHNLTLTVNKIESDCVRNKMIADKKMEEILSFVNQLKKRAINRGIHDTSASKQRERSRSVSMGNKSPANRREQDKSQGSSISKKQSKSITRKTKQFTSKSEHQPPSTTRVFQQKKIKQNELKQALRRKKQNQEKLKMKK